MNKIPGISLILVNTVNYCTILYDYLTENCPGWEFHIIHGEIKNREEIIQKMKESSEKFCIIATVKTMSTGVSINNLQYIYFPDGGKSEVSMGQSIGRLMRLFSGKKLCKFFDFHDNMKNSAFKNHYLVRMKYYKKKNFPIKITEVTI